MSIICLSVIGFLTVFQSVKLIGRSDPELNMYEIESNYEYANFRELGFTFAVQSIDKRVGGERPIYAECVHLCKIFGIRFLKIFH